MLAITKSAYLESECLPILLNDFINGINELQSTGIEIKIRNHTFVIKGFLACCLGDTPALNKIGGFVVGVGKAIRCCRNCEVARDERASYLTEDPSTLRTYEKHEEQLEIFKLFPKMMTIFGLKFKSCFLEINNFNVCTSLLHDPMHVIIEGICIAELKCLLSYAFSQGIISLAELNRRIKDFNYPKEDRNDVPNILDKKDIKKQTLPLSAGQMMTLIQNLPFILLNKEYQCV